MSMILADRPAYHQSYYASKKYQVFYLRIPTHQTNVASRFVVRTNLIENYTKKELDNFIVAIASVGATIKSGPGFGCCLRVRRVDNRWTVHQEFWPGLLENLPRAHRYESRIHLSSLVDGNFAATGYLTHATAIVGFNGEIFVAKSPEDGDKASDYMEEAHTLRLLRNDSIIAGPRFFIEHSERIIGFLLKYYPNGNVRDYTVRLREKGSLRLDLFRKWSIQFATALRYLLNKQQEYENIKPENCVVNETEDLILIDFAPNACCNEYGRAPEVFYRHSVHEMLGRLLYGQPFGTNNPGRRGIPITWPDEAREKALVFSLARTLWMIFESIPSNKFPERASTGYPYKTIFTASSTDLPHRWKNFILRCVSTDPLERPTLRQVATFFEEEREPIAWRLRSKRKITLEEASDLEKLRLESRK